MKSSSLWFGERNERVNTIRMEYVKEGMKSEDNVINSEGDNFSKNVF
jgi:hypothetical protein